MKDDDIQKVDYLAKYRGGGDEQVTNAQMLTFCPVTPKEIDANLYTHISMAYTLLNRVDYFNGRQGSEPEEEKLHLTFVNGQVLVFGFFLEKLHRRILRREVDQIRAVHVETDEELDAVRQQPNGKPIVTHILIVLTDDPNENARFPEEETDDIAETRSVP